MIIALDGIPPRDLSTVSFADITTVPLVGFPPTEDGDPQIEFSGDLTSVEVQRVQMRAMATAIQQDIQDKAIAAFKANQTFLALAAPTNAQTLAQVKLLTRECNALIRMAFGLYDSADGA